MILISCLTENKWASYFVRTTRGRPTMKKKVAYKIKNWKTYNRSLINRGNITIWIEDSFANWYDLEGEGVGRPRTYSDDCIKLALTIRILYQLSLRATQGWLEGFVHMMKLIRLVPHYSILSRRMRKLNIGYNLKTKKGKIDIVIDSTGYKIYGEGEWKMRTHGKAKRRTWKKLHLSMDPNDFNIESVELTASNVADCKIFAKLTKEIKDLGNTYLDGAYLSEICFEEIAKKGGRPFVNIRDGTCLSKKKTLGLEKRNDLIKEMRACGGKQNWKKISGYHKRSLVETQMFRLKTIFGPRLKSRNFNNQKIEVQLIASALNRMTILGMPDSYSIAA